MMRTTLLLAALTASLGISGCGKRGPEIPFAPAGEGYEKKVDLAQLEHKYPLSPAYLQKITPANLSKLSQEELDQIYARLTAGPIPDGPFDGGILFPRGSSGKFRASEIVGGFAGLALHLKGLKLDAVGERLWQGKVFYRNERVLRNRIDDLGALRKLGLVQGEPEKISVHGKDAWLLFPAKLYCGQSLFDSRRESVIIDYFFTDEIQGYREHPDFLAGRRGVRVRDEIRMIRPGFYLGRAYLDRIFGLNFTLYNKEIADKEGEAFVKTGHVAEDCWPGTQPRVVASK